MSVDNCVVHGPTNASKFQTTLLKLRRMQEFSGNIYQQLPKQCCSCYGISTVTSFDVDGLRKICLNLISSTTKKKDSDDENDDLKPIHWKKNKKKQQMKFDRRTDLQQQMDDYEANDDAEEDDDHNDNGNYHHVTNSLYMKNDQRPTKPSDLKKIALEAKREERRKIFHKLSKSFTPIVVPFSCCMIHDRKYQSQFNYVLNQLRLGFDYRKGVFYDFTKQCCSCNREKLFNSINPREFKHELDRIESIPVVKTEKKFDWIVLPLAQDESAINRSCKTGYFIGKNGQNLRTWQNQYNVRINIIDAASTEKVKNRLWTVAPTGDANGLVLLFEKRDETNDESLKTNELKADILKAWAEAKNSDEGIHRSRRRRLIHRRRYP